MTEYQKQIVLKDLCSRLPYNVKVAIDFQSYLACLPDDEDLEYPYRKNLNFILGSENKTIEDISTEPNIVYSYPGAERFKMLRGYTYQEDYGVPVEFIKPYLRPMSSMTEEEEREVRILWNEDYADKISLYHCYPKTTEFYNKHHFDYRGLIPMGLALEAPEGMYK